MDRGGTLGPEVYLDAGPLVVSRPEVTWYLSVVSSSGKTEMGDKVVIFKIDRDHPIFLAKVRRETGHVGCGKRSFPK